MYFRIQNCLDCREYYHGTTIYHKIPHQSFEQHSINTLNNPVAKKKMHIPIKSDKTEPHISSGQVFLPKKLQKNPFYFWNHLESELGIRDCGSVFSFHIYKILRVLSLIFHSILYECEHFPHVNVVVFIKTCFSEENQDGGVGRHTAPPRTTRTDRKSNGKEVRQQVDKKETYIQTCRGAETGTGGGEDSRDCGRTETGGVWMNRAGSRTTSRPCGSTFAHR